VITIGIDAHKRLHVAVALDESGREIGRWQGANTDDAWRRCLDWATDLSESRAIGIEGALGLGRGLAQFLVANGETVYEVNPRLTSLARRSARSLAKNDRLDAHAIAEAVRQHAEDLPTVYLDDDSTLLNLLATERDDLLAASIRIQNQLHAILGHVDPLYHRRFVRLTSKSALSALQGFSSERTDPVTQERVRSVRRLADRLALTVAHIEEVSAHIRSIAAQHYQPLTQICGVNLLTAGTLAAILGPAGRFSSDAELAAYAGVAPLEASSAGRTRHRLNRRHAIPGLPEGTDLHRAPRSRGQDQARGISSPQALHRPRDLEDLP
jgi:transposase